MSGNKEAKSNQDPYQWVGERNLPKYTQPSTFTSKAPARSRLARHHPVAPKRDLSHLSPSLASSHRSAADTEDWEQLSDASGAEENGTEEARVAQQEAARKEREAAFHSDQEARKMEQNEINRRMAEEKKASEAKKAARREWYNTGGMSTAPVEEKQGFFDRLGKWCTK